MTRSVLLSIIFHSIITNYIFFSKFSSFVIFAVFTSSGFTRTLCGSTWDILTGDKKWFGHLGGSTPRHGCCPANEYMSKPFFNEDPSSQWTSTTGWSFNSATSCSPCPTGTIVSSLTTVPNDETSCELCPSGKSSNGGMSNCDLTTVKLPNGNGKQAAAERVGDTLERIVDDILGTDISKKDVVTEKYGPIENWDVSDVTDISYLFYTKRTMNADLSSWNVSSVTTMYRST